MVPRRFFGKYTAKRLLTTGGGSAILVKLSDVYEPLAQLAEQLPFKQWVRGSNPRRLTKGPECFCIRGFFYGILKSEKATAGSKKIRGLPRRISHMQWHARCGRSKATWISKRKISFGKCGKQRLSGILLFSNNISKKNGRTWLFRNEAPKRIRRVDVDTLCAF